MNLSKTFTRWLRPVACGADICRQSTRPGLLNPILAMLIAGVATFAARASDVYFADAGTNRPAAGAAITAAAAAAAPDSATNSSVVSLINNMDVLDDKHKLAVGDKISFRVVEDEDDPKTLTVNDDGDVQVPYIGIYPARGKTCKQLAKELKVALEKKYYYHATVIISVDSEVTQGIVYLVGAVQKPGPEEIPRDETLTVGKAILRAGGFTDFADEKHVRVTRNGEDGTATNEVFTVDVSQIFEKGRTEDDRVLQPGDLIYVPERMIRF